MPLVPWTYVASVVFNGYNPIEILPREWRHCYRHTGCDFDTALVTRRDAHRRWNWTWLLANNSTGIKKNNNNSTGINNVARVYRVLLGQPPFKNALCALSQWTFTTALWDGDSYSQPHFTEEETEVQRVTCLRQPQLVCSTFQTPATNSRPLGLSQSLGFVALCVAKILNFSIVTKQ